MNMTRYWFNGEAYVKLADVLTLELEAKHAQWFVSLTRALQPPAPTPPEQETP